MEKYIDMNQRLRPVFDKAIRINILFDGMILMDDLIDLCTNNQQNDNFMEIMGIIERRDNDCDGKYNLEEFTDVISSFRYTRKNLIAKVTKKLNELIAMENGE